MQVIRGVLALEGEPTDLAGAEVSVRLLDVSRTDAAAIAVAEHRLAKLPRGTSSTQEIGFELTVDALQSGAHYTIAAHVDRDGDGRTSIGDYVTMESVPVSGADPKPSYVVKLRKVTA